MANKKYMRPIVVDNATLSPAIKVLMTLVEAQAKTIKENEHKIAFLKKQNKELIEHVNKLKVIGLTGRSLGLPAVTGRSSAAMPESPILAEFMRQAKQHEIDEMQKKRDALINLNLEHANVRAKWYEKYIESHIEANKKLLKPNMIIIDDVETDK